MAVIISLVVPLGFNNMTYNHFDIPFNINVQFFIYLIITDYKLMLVYVPIIIFKSLNYFLI